MALKAPQSIACGLQAQVGESTAVSALKGQLSLAKFSCGARPFQRPLQGRRLPLW